MSSTTYWSEILQAGFTDVVDGVDCVLFDSNQEANTFHVTHGKLEYMYVAVPCMMKL